MPHKYDKFDLLSNQSPQMCIGAGIQIMYVCTYRWEHTQKLGLQLEAELPITPQSCHIRTCHSHRCAARSHASRRHLQSLSVDQTHPQQWFLRLPRQQWGASPGGGVDVSEWTGEENRWEGKEGVKRVAENNGTEGEQRKGRGGIRQGSGSLR